MNNDIFKNNRFNKISRNGIMENDKFGIIKKFGFMSSFMSTSLQSKTKSFVESKKNINTNELSNKKNTTNKSFINRINKSSSKPIILKTKSIKKINPIMKEDFPIRKCQNIFSYTQKMNFKASKKKNKTENISNDFFNSYYIKNSPKKKNSNDILDINDENKNRTRIKSIIFNKSVIIKNKNRKKIASYEKILNENYKLKYKFLFGKEKANNNINVNDIKNIKSNNYDSNNSNTMTLVSDQNSASTKKEKFKIFRDEQTFKNSNENNMLDFDSQDKNKNNKEIENYYIINDKLSSEIFSDKYYKNNLNVIEPCKNFNLVEDGYPIDENICRLDEDISEKRSDENNLDKNSNLINNMNINNFVLFNNKDNEVYDKPNIRNNYLLTKLTNLLKNNDSCNISPRNDLNEISKINNDKQLNEKKYKFISDIQKYTEKLPILNIKNFLNLKDYGLFTLMGFIYNYSSNLIRANSAFLSKIKNSFCNIFSDTIKNFSNTYSSFLKVINYYFENRKLKINKKYLYAFNLVIICKVITKQTNKSYDISYNYISNDKEYDNLWKIDILKKSNIKIWLHTELYKINNRWKTFTYSSQISSFCYGDEIKFEINIFNQKQQLNPYSIKWLPPEITDIENDNFEANKFISSSAFDPLRCNEIEIQTLVWKEIPITDNKNDLLNEFFKIFERNFIIKKIDTYTSKHVFYKIKTVANKKGIFLKNKYLFFDLNIIDYDEPLKNEVQSIYLMNSNYYNKKMDIRLGTVVFFYITDFQS